MEKRDPIPRRVVTVGALPALVGDDLAAGFTTYLETGDAAVTDAGGVRNGVGSAVRRGRHLAGRRVVPVAGHAAGRA